MVGLPPSINLPVYPFRFMGSEMHCESQMSYPTTQCPRQRLEPGPPNKLAIREFKKLRRRRRRERRLKNEFIFYLRISRHSEVIYFVYHCQNYHETESRTQR